MAHFFKFKKKVKLKINNLKRNKSALSKIRPHQNPGPRIGPHKLGPRKGRAHPLRRDLPRFAHQIQKKKKEDIFRKIKKKNTHHNPLLP